MAGRPKERSSEQRLLTLGPHAEGLIWNALYAGQSVNQIALTFGYTFKTLSDWIYDPRRADTLKRVRERSADHLVAEALRIADGPYTVPLSRPGGYDYTLECLPEEARKQRLEGRPAADATGAEIFADAARDKLRIQHRQWLASRWNKETYGAQPMTAITIDARSLHIDALRRQPSNLQTTERLLTASSVQPADSKGVPLESGPVEPPGMPLTRGVRGGGTIAPVAGSSENIQPEDKKKVEGPPKAEGSGFRAAAPKRPAAKGVKAPAKVYRNPGAYISPTRKEEMEKEAKKAARKQKRLGEQKEESGS